MMGRDLTNRSSRPARLSRGLQCVKNHGKPLANRPGGLALSVGLAMNRIRGYVIGLAVVSLMLSACVDDPPVEPGPPTLFGFVSDSSGSPIRDVEVHYIYYTKYNTDSWTGFEMFEFPSYRTEPATVEIINPLGKVIEKLLDGDTVESGENMVTFQTRVTNGIYSCRITTPDTLITYIFGKRTDNLDSLASVAPLVTTNSGGLFSLTARNLGIGVQVPSYYLDEVVRDSITIVLFKNGYQPYTETFLMDTTRNRTRYFTMHGESL
jgi:hypothetical protein